VFASLRAKAQALEVAGKKRSEAIIPVDKEARKK
jgi:hypothetical protein